MRRISCPFDHIQVWEWHLRDGDRVEVIGDRVDSISLDGEALPRGLPTRPGLGTMGRKTLVIAPKRVEACD